MTRLAIAPIQAILASDPAFLTKLSPEQRAVLPYLYDVWRRPDQHIPPDGWRSFGLICGRGFGKTWAYATHINERVQRDDVRSLALMAPTTDRVRDVQIAFLEATAPPWQRPIVHNGVLEWPCGATAEIFTPEAPGRSRSGNYELTWLCEIVDWQSTTRREAFDNITTATRIGRAQYLWDTTAKGKNDVILKLLEAHNRAPQQNRLRRGSTFDNPLLSRVYLQEECQKYTGRRFAEEILGRVFGEAAGALWRQAWLDNARVQSIPTAPEISIVSIDPAKSTHHDADDTGLLEVHRTPDGHVYASADHSGKLTIEQWGDMAVNACVNRGFAGVIVERSGMGDHPRYVLTSRAANHNYQVRVLQPGKPFPLRTPGVIYVREIIATQKKDTRAEGAASETESGRVHLVGEFPDLEIELTTWEPGSSKSPNRLDAFAQGVNELRDLTLERPSPVADMHTAAETAEAVNRHLRGIGRGRRVGL